MKKTTPKTAKTFGDWAYLAIAEHYQHTVEREAGVLAAKDPEELHQMRVGMRRLRSAIAGFGRAIALPKHSRAKDVARIARTLGALRDLDVLEITLTNQYQNALPKAEQKQLKKAFKFLKKQRKKCLQNVKIALNGKDYQQLKQGFESWLKQPSYQQLANLPIFFVLPDLLLPQTSQLLLHPGWFVGTKIVAGKVKVLKSLNKTKVEALLERQAEALHDLRKEAKRSRYQMELFTSLADRTYKHQIKDIKAVQTVLGDLQDCCVLAEFLATALESDLECKMPALAAQLRTTRYQKWQAWQILQSQFLAVETRRDLRTLSIEH